VPNLPNGDRFPLAGGTLGQPVRDLLERRSTQLVSLQSSLGITLPARLYSLVESIVASPGATASRT
jgi:hypothetical protein